MKAALTAILASTILSATASAHWDSRITGQWNKFALCSSDTGTDGDLLFEVPVVLTEETSTWMGEDFGSTKKGDTYIRKNIVVEKSTKAGHLADVTDVSPMTKFALKMKMTRHSGNFDISLPKAGYRIILPSSINEAGELLAADSYQGEIGVSRCSLNDQAYNDNIGSF